MYDNVDHDYMDSYIHDINDYAYNCYDGYSDYVLDYSNGYDNIDGYINEHMNSGYLN